MTNAFLALGSNINPEKNMLEAVRQLSQYMQILKSSMVYLTEPLRNKRQNCYYNCVIEVETEIPVLSLKFNVIRSIEEAMGRKRTANKYESRVIDIDIALYGEQQICTRELLIPDPEIQKRAFLALSIFELEPHLILPGVNMPMEQIASKFKNHTMKPLNHFTQVVCRLIIELSVQKL